MWDLDGFSYIGFYPWLVFLRDLRYDTTYAGYKMISIEIYICITPPNIDPGLSAWRLISTKKHAWLVGISTSRKKSMQIWLPSGKLT